MPVYLRYLAVARLDSSMSTPVWIVISQLAIFPWFAKFCSVLAAHHQQFQSETDKIFKQTMSSHEDVEEFGFEVSNSENRVKKGNKLLLKLLKTTNIYGGYLHEIDLVEQILPKRINCTLWESLMAWWT